MNTLCALRRILFAAAAVAAIPAAISGAERQPIDFNRDARPILSKMCFNCHGPDEGHRKAGLRLDLRESATKDLESGQVAINPGKPEESELFLRISSENADERMPPKSTGHVLSAEQIEMLRRWIESGAQYSEHWSFTKPVRPSLPDVQQVGWPRNPIDYFVLARLEAAGLSPLPEADRYAIIRRLSFDLRGLPPAPNEVRAFMEDPCPDAYERLVDQFLNDGAYGERWARMWLDLARYADSKGYGFDSLRTIWRYRDWLIDAFNRNLRFDQFTIEQLAGDLLESPTLDQLIATAFHRNTLSNVEGMQDEESRVSAVQDRVDTTLQVWMGLTMGCAKCHSHKFDPISQAEYYQLYAFLNQTLDSDSPDEAPTILAPPADMAPILRNLDAQIAAAKTELAVPEEQLCAEQAIWESVVCLPIDWVTLEPTEFLSESGAKFIVREDGSVFVEGDLPANDEYTLITHLGVKDLTALRLETIPDQSLPGAGAGRAPDGNFVLSRISASISPPPRKRPPTGTSDDVSDSPQQAETGDRAQTSGNSTQSGRSASADNASAGRQSEIPLEFAGAAADFSQPDFPVGNAISQADLTKSGWGVANQTQMPHAAYFLVKPISDQPCDSRLTVRLEHRFHLPRHVLGRFRLSVTSSPHAASRVPVPLEILQIVEKEPDERTDEQRAKLAEFFRAVAPSLAPLRARMAEIERQRPAVPTVPVLAELPIDRRRETKIMFRGNHLNLGNTVQPAVLSRFHAMPAGAPMNRLGLARWLVANDNPLTARVTVNRFWSQLFGTGIVETEEDFGTQGEPPSHAELLDWLATEFVEPGSNVPSLTNGSEGKTGEAGQDAELGVHSALAQLANRNSQFAWDVKRLLKLIVMSATYRQTSQVTADRLDADPRNRLLSRGPRFRLEAEMVRDQALALSGLLSRKTHGPSVYPPQPPGVWQIAFSFERNWATSTGEDRYRRGLYTFWRRSAPYPSLVAFDAPTRELCTLRRNRTNTPLQALVTLNDPVYVEAAQAMARRIVREAGETDAARARFGLELCRARPATSEQIAEVLALYRQSLNDCATDETAAAQLATDPLGPLPEGASATELAAWTVVANVLLNLDSVLMKN
ncbi:MAG: PSD1 and planctomycete cytochrome C domain-containing protein [Planctomycetaceae bacterium]